MLDRIRLATEEEVKEIATNSNLTSTSSVWRMGDMSMVWRIANELDPAHFNGATPQKIYKFVWGMENLLKGAGAREYFFQVSATDTTYHKFIEGMGGERLSKEPEYRYRVNL